MQPSTPLINQVRAGFVLQNTSFSRACFEINVDPRNAFKALNGSWNGDKAEQVKQSLIARSRSEEIMNFLTTASSADSFQGGVA